MGVQSFFCSRSTGVSASPHCGVDKVDPLKDEGLDDGGEPGHDGEERGIVAASKCSDFVTVLPAVALRSVDV